MAAPVEDQPSEYRPEGQAPLLQRLVFLAALVFAPLLFFGIRLMPMLVRRSAFEALILALGGGGFVGL